MSSLNYILDGDGLTLPTLNNIIVFLENGFKNIYGNDINLNSNTPDGQIINIFAQILTDINEVIISLYNSLNPNLSVGVSLDSLVAYHMIARNKGSYTIVPITINVNKSLTIKGLDNNYNSLEASNVFTVSDNSGNQFYLINSYTFEAEEKNKTLQFRAKDIGQVQVSLESITNIDTPQVGIISVINSSNVTTTGANEETDLSLRDRFNKTYANGGMGAFDNIISALLSLEGVTIASGENNSSNVTSLVGTPPHSVWLIVQGGSDEDIANAIYSTLNAGCGMRGDTIYTVYTPQNVAVDIRWDRPSYEDLYIRFTITKKNSDTVADIDYLKEQLVTNLTLNLYQTIDVNQISCILKNIQSDLIYTDIKLSKDNNNWLDIITNTNYNYIFELSKDNISIINI